MLEAPRVGRQGQTAELHDMYTAFFWNILILLIIVIIIILNQRKFLLLIHSFCVLSTHRRKVLQVLSTHQIWLVPFMQPNSRLSQKICVFSHGSTALMRTVCLVICECLTEAEDRPISPCLQRMLFFMYWILRQTDFKAPCWKSVCWFVVWLRIKDLCSPEQKRGC